MSAKPTSVQEYVEQLEPRARKRIDELRTLVTSTAPNLTAQLKWGVPAYLHPDGVIMLATSAHKTHANFTVTPSTREAFAKELADLETGKGSVKLPYDGDIPRELLDRMIRYRLREHEEDGVMWM